MRIHKKLLLLAMILCLLVSSTACTLIRIKDEYNSDLEVAAPSFETETLDEEFYTAQLTSAWQKAGDLEDSKAIVLVPDGVAEDQVTSNIVVACREVLWGKTWSYDTCVNRFETEYEPALKEQYPNMTDMEYSEFEAPQGLVFVATYQTEPGEDDQYIYYFRLTSFYVMVTACDLHDGANAEETARYLVNTLKLKND